MIQFGFTLASRWSQPCRKRGRISLAAERLSSPSNDGGDNTSELVKKFTSMSFRIFFSSCCFASYYPCCRVLIRRHRHTNTENFTSFDTTVLSLAHPSMAVTRLIVFFPSTFSDVAGIYVRNMKIADFDLHICAMLQDANQIQIRISAPIRQQHKIFLCLCVFSCGGSWGGKFVG